MRCGARHRLFDRLLPQRSGRDRSDDELRLRRGDHWLGVRWQRCRAPLCGEGLPGRRPGGRQALEGRRHSEDPVESAGLLVASRSRVVRDPEDRVPGRCAHPLRRRRGRRLACLCQHVVCPAEAVLRCAGMGWHHRLGRRTGAVHRPGNPDARRRPVPVYAYRRGPVPAAGRARDGERGDVQQGPGGCLLRQPGRRGRRPVLRRGWTAAHRLHLMRQLHYRLRPQRQEQADDQLPLPGGKARRRDLSAARGVRPCSARWRRV